MSIELRYNKRKQDFSQLHTVIDELQRIGKKKRELSKEVKSLAQQESILRKELFKLNGTLEKTW